jgi:hypothetical protein
MLPDENGVIPGSAVPDSGAAPDPVNNQDASATGAGIPVAPTPGDKTVPLAALHEERQRRQETQSQLSMLQAQLAELKGMVGAQTATAPGYPGTPVPAAPQINPLDTVWNNEEMWNRDPKAAVRNSVQAEILAALQWYDSQSMTMAAQEADVMKKFPDYASYKVRIEQRLNQMPLQQRVLPGVREAAYFMEKGQSVDQIVSRQQQELMERIKRGEVVQGLTPGLTSPNATPAPQGGAGTLSEDQLRAAAMMNLTPEQYASAIVTRK